MIRSAELASSGRRLESVSGTCLYFNAATEDHWNLWESAATRLSSALSSLGLNHKAIVLSTPWAKVDDLGGPVESFGGLDQDSDLRAYLIECFAHINSLGYKVLTLPPELAVAHSTHKWGPFWSGRE
ncbi:DUF6270 domain-containing protein [Pseudarthrobacter sp. J47]|uniref:DUF6270 domain-containing protein n=1 Tax=Pseudarthrobacter sp. J47 TaxID=3116482 RepID=UPI003CC67CDE